MLPRLAFAVVVLLALPSLLLARPDGIFDLPKEKAQRAMLTVGDVLPASFAGAGSSPSSPTSTMLLNLEGVLASLNSKELAQLASSPQANSKMLDARGELRRVCVVHLFGKDKDAAKRVEILCGPDGIILARELEPISGKPGVSPRVVKLDAERYRQASLEWPRYRGAFETNAPAEGAVSLPTRPGLTDESFGPPLVVVPGVTVELPSPRMPAPMMLDQKLLGDRFLNGRRSNIPAADRLLSQEKMYLRVPRSYDPRHPVGLLVWINAGTEGRPPQVFNKALDELGIACVGIANVDNLRPVANRYQLALDAVFAASTRLHIDPRRVYITGISGGGRVSSMLGACFPDYFTGSIPIVGLSSYQRVPLGNSHYAPAGYERPGDKRFALFRSRRMAAITGGEDFNHSEIVMAAGEMKKDGVQIRVFDYEKLGHQLPSPEQFLQALTWTDAPYQELVKKDEASAKIILEKFIQKFGPGPARDDEARAELVKVTEVGPWGEAAWKAVELLGAR
ncbi:MAG: hypothetical protein H7210_12210 [Pyrinomonadaceae bacterium]|nr:hypothetical protein [Phycisphaerales bacterium]